MFSLETKTERNLFCGVVLNFMLHTNTLLIWALHQSEQEQNCPEVWTQAM